MTRMQFLALPLLALAAPIAKAIEPKPTLLGKGPLVLQNVEIIGGTGPCLQIDCGGHVYLGAGSVMRPRALNK